MTGETSIVLDAESFGDEGEAEMTQWHVKEGSRVEADQPVAELSTNKAIIEVQSPVAGTIHRLIEIGELVSPGTPIATVTT